MKIALAQMSMTADIAENLKKSLAYCDEAAGCDLLFFPEIQLSPFFPQYEKKMWTPTPWARTRRLSACWRRRPVSIITIFPPTSIWNGTAIGTMLRSGSGRTVRCRTFPKWCTSRRQSSFTEQDYYTPSEDGFKVFDTPFGKIGIVICYDRHLPESIRTCVLMGAELVIVPTANTKAELLEMFEWEMRVQAMQNQVFIAMCNRVGTEGDMDFAGESLVIHPSGAVLKKADDTEQLLTCSIDLAEASSLRKKIPYLSTRRPECYL